MAHGGQKGALGLVGFVRGFLGCLRSFFGTFPLTDLMADREF
jgi:hypothetical protein